MSAGGVIPEPAARQPHFAETGRFVTAHGQELIFGADRGDVVILNDGDFVLTYAEQDMFARHLFRAMHVAEAPF